MRNPCRRSTVLRTRSDLWLAMSAGVFLLVAYAHAQNGPSGQTAEGLLRQVIPLLQPCQVASQCRGNPLL